MTIIIIIIMMNAWKVVTVSRSVERGKLSFGGANLLFFNQINGLLTHYRRVVALSEDTHDYA